MCEALRELMKDDLETATRMGAKEAQLTAVRNMLERGYDNEEIAAIVSLPEEIIEKERRNRVMI